MSSGNLDSIPFCVLLDGTISLKTDAISGTNHKSADELLADLAETLGGTHTVKNRTDVHHATLHSHDHGKTHHHH